MNEARVIVAVIGAILPYVVRLPRGIGWVEQYFTGGLGGFLFFSAFNAIAWGAIIGISFLYKRPSCIITPALFGFGFLGWAHYALDLAADAQAAIALIFIPIFALLPIAVGGGLGYLVDRRLKGRDAA